MTYLIAFIASAFVLCFCIYLYVINVKRYVDKEMKEKDLANPKVNSFYPTEQPEINKWFEFIYKNKN